jgi:hypothetical protein
VALGNALVARSHADALYVNPAGLAHLDKSEFRVHSDRTDVDRTTNFAAHLALGQAGVAAISYRLVDQGTTDAKDKYDNVTGSMSLYDHLLAASYAADLGRFADIGVTYMFYQWRLDCAGYCGPYLFSGSTSLVDVGANLRLPWIPALQIGVAALHLGLPLQVHNAAQSDPTPALLRIGAAYEFRTDSTTQLVAAFDLVRGIHSDVEESAAVGLELVMDECLFVRAGYSSVSGKGAGGAVGVGMVWSRFEVDVGKSFAVNFDGTEAFQVTFAIGF